MKICWELKKIVEKELVLKKTKTKKKQGKITSRTLYNV